MKFRRCKCIDTLEKVYDRLVVKLSGDDFDALMSASDHRRAEIQHGKLWDRVPASAWRNVE
ncbi:Hha/YmoA family nucleoid-associated regulatory protein [Buttiauxella sp. B2]|uniref:Hha/YmoA family nucleoid-associated regulatory protein n=1 Tax=Buttiauxella sp. B2 TaxID=2587812 RepID=UPI001CB9789C|nr:Hha/YmoA family nucleoid-associated regulatory protein [Buttiauxella sp. B2]